MLIEQGAMQKSQQATCGHRLDNTLTTHYPIHHHMALQTMSGPGLPCWGFATITFLQGRIVSPAPNPQPPTWIPSLRIYGPRRQSGPAIPPGTGYPFQSPFTTCMGYSGTILSSLPPYGNIIQLPKAYKDWGQMI
jgi:hypothetical protein